MSGHAKAVGGPVLAGGMKWVLAVLIVGLAAMAWRLVAGIGAVTGLNDGYPWGIWIAYDVVVGTALACGGYAVAILTYILNKGKYHPLVRSAVLTSALGYSVAAVAIVIDVGRYWYIWKLPVSVNWWNHTSFLLEVALCVMSYVVVLWIEMSPAFMEKWKENPDSFLGRISRTMLPVLDKALIWILALGLILPTMHQSSLGAVMLIATSKIDPLWYSGWLPLLFLLSCIAMGYAVVVFESTLSSLGFRRPLETRMLGNLGKGIVVATLLFLALRVGDWAVRGQFGRLFSTGSYSFFVLLETALFLAPTLMLLSGKVRNSARSLFVASMMLILAGSLYRFNVYLIGFDPGTNWTYFPAVPELLITFGIVALEILAYVYFVKRFPILAAHRPARRGGPAPAAAGN